MTVWLKFGIYLALLVSASMWDIRHREIPDECNVLIGLLCLMDFDASRLWGALIAVPFLVVAVHCGGMGGGDIKFMFANGMLLGIERSILAAIAGLVSVLLFYAVWKIITRRKKADCPQSFPLAPFLSMGCLIGYLIM